MVYDNAMKQSYPLAQLRSILLYLSISLLTLCALLGILAVLSQEVDWRILLTTFCAAIASLIAMSNISRLADNRIVIKILSINYLQHSVVCWCVCPPVEPLSDPWFLSALYRHKESIQ